MLLSLKSEVLLRIFYKNPVQRYEKFLIYANNLMNFLWYSKNNCSNASVANRVLFSN